MNFQKYTERARGFVQPVGWGAPDVFCAISAAYLVLSPYMFRFAGTAAWTAILMGVVLGLLVLAGRFRPDDWPHWAGVALGLLTVMAPWLLAFSDVGNAAGMHVFAGLVVTIASALELWSRRPG